MLPELLLRPLARTLHSRALTSPQVRATDDPVALSGYVDALRILIVGSGITSGWGVKTYGLALVGALQQTLQKGLDRPVDVEQVSAVGGILSDAAQLLGDRATERWDAIVIAFGLSDAMRLTPTREWAQALDRLLAKLDGDMPPGGLVPIVITAMPKIDGIGLMTPLASIFRRQPERLNALTQRAVARNRRTTFVSMPMMANAAERPQGSPEAYQAWADALAPQLVALLARHDDAEPAVRHDEQPGGPPVGGAEPASAGEEQSPPTEVAVAPAPHSRFSPSRSGVLRRRSRLRTEGSQLTRSAIRRSFPEGRDVRVQGPDPIRVLLVGGEYGVGFGTTDRAKSLDGALAGLLHLRTGRGVIVENRCQHLVRLEQLATSLGPAGAHTFDLVVWTPTFIEATRLLLRSRMIAGLSLMLRKIESTSDAAVVLVGFPSLLGAQPLAIIGRTRVLQINRMLRRIATRHDRVLVAEPPAITLSTVDTVDGVRVYHDAAVSLLPSVMRLLQPVEAGVQLGGRLAAL